MSDTDDINGKEEEEQGLEEKGEGMKRRRASDTSQQSQLTSLLAPHLSQKSGTPDSSQPPTPTSSSALQSELSIPSGEGDDPVETDAEPSDVRLSPLLSEKRPSLLSPISEQRRLGYNAR